MYFEENNEEFEGKVTRNLKEKHREFFTRVFTAKCRYEILYRLKKTYINYDLNGVLNLYYTRC